MSVDTDSCDEDSEEIAWVYHIYQPLGQDMTQGQFFKRSLTCLNSVFSFS